MKEGVLRSVIHLILLFSLLSLILGAEEVALDLCKFLIRHPNGGWYQVMAYTYKLHSEN